MRRLIFGKNMKESEDKKMNQMRELNPEDMDKVSGGQGGYGTGDASGTADSSTVCPSSPNGNHEWFYMVGKPVRRCKHCHIREETSPVANFF